MTVPILSCFTFTLSPRDEQTQQWAPGVDEENGVSVTLLLVQGARGAPLAACHRLLPSLGGAR